MWIVGYVTPLWGVFCRELGTLADGIYTYKQNTTLSNGYLGSRNDEERSEMRYVMRIAEFSESSNL